MPVPPPRFGQCGLSAAEVTLFLLDWMCTHKVTDACADHMWSLVKTVIPGEVDVDTWRKVKRLLTTHEARYCLRIEVCVNDCVAYWNSKNLPTPYRHEHRSICPVCVGLRGG